MQFANPRCFLALIPLAIWILFRWKSDRSTALPFSDFFLLKSRIKMEFNPIKFLAILKWISFGLMIAALARPQSISKMGEPPRPVVDIMICLDTSLSMSALDFDGQKQNRLDAAKNAAIEFVKKRPFDRIGLVVFGGRAITQCPLTLDHETLIDFLKSVPMNATQTDGTAIGSAIALSAARLTDSEAKTKIIILLTDGRNNMGNIDPLTAAGSAGDLGIKIYTIGTAVPGGGLVPIDDPRFGRRLVQMAEDLDEPVLQQIAITTSAKYYRVTSIRRFREIYDEIDKMEKTKVETGMTQEYRDLYLPFLFIAMVLLCSEIILKNTIWRTVP